MEHAAKKLVGRLLPQGILPGLLLGMMLCFSLIPCVTVQAETVIDSVEATVTQPVGWAKVSSITATPGNGTYQANIKYIQEWDANYKSFVSRGPGAEITAGEKYQIVINFVPEKGYTFSDSLTASINGNAASRYTMKDGLVCFSHIFIALPTNSKETCMEVSSIAVKSNVQTPATGAAITNPSCDIISNSAMTVQETGWINGDTGIKGSGVFTAGNWYCYVLLRLEGDAYTKYKFAAKGNMTLTVNGSKWTVTEATNGTDYATVRAVSTTWALNGNTPTHSHTAKAVAAKAATCTQAGNTAYYICSGCNKWFKDAACTTEITDQNSVEISATGHTWSEKIEDEAHLKEKAADCCSYNTYWYDCAVCNTISKTQFFVSDTQKGSHSYKSEWNKGDASGHWHICQYCKEPDTVKAHVPGPAATETTPQTCTECGYVIAPALGHTHNVTFVTAKAATCTETGNTAYYTCSGCGKWFKDAGCTTEITDQSSVVNPATGHRWSEEIEDEEHVKDRAADCRSYNTYWYDCAVCDAISGNQFFVSKTQQGAHSYETEWNKGDASGHWHKCQYCGEHDTVVAHAPGPAATEETPQTCTECGYIITPELEHTHNVTYVAAQEATCTEKGNTAYYTCSGCGKWFKDAGCTTEISDHSSVVKPANGHKWSEQIEDEAHLKGRAANCRSCNTYWYDCAVCDAISGNQFFTSETKEGAHSYKSEWNKGDASGHWHNCQYCGERDTVVAHVPGSAATETSPQTCTKCGYIIVPAKGHTTHDAVYVAAQEATCIKKGNEAYYTCSGCEKWFRDAECTEEIQDHSSVMISALGHSWSEKIEDKSHLKKAAADCRSCNVYWYDCVMCDAISSNKYFTGKTRGAHSYEDEWNEGDASGHWHDCQYCDAHDAVKAHIPGPPATEENPQTCTECGYVIKDTLIEEDSKGTQTTNGETNPTNSDNKETSDELPEEGTTLEDDSGKAIYEIVIEGDTVEYVSTISRSTATVTIPSTVTIDNVTYKVTGIADDAFKNNKTVKKVVIGKNVTTIGNSAFSGAVKLKAVTIGANVTSIGDKAFYKCTALTKITIPSKVTKIGKSAFYGCKNLKNITIKTTKLTTKKVGSKAFYGIHKKATIKVPKSKYKAYKTMLKGKGLRKSINIEK
ncbi:MAG: leucine-rich repeat domain-containing protein [Clostridiales bacterium]|nr:leucine-rich repeat domain-containing protein [Clostridiales bacterium]